MNTALTPSLLRPCLLALLPALLLSACGTPTVFEMQLPEGWLSFEEVRVRYELPASQERSPL